MNTISRRPLAISAAVLTVLVVIGVLVLRLVGGEDDKTSTAGPMNSTAAVAAMLSVDDLGAGYEPGTGEATSYLAQAPGCLGAVRGLIEGTDAPVHVLKTFVGPSTAPASAVSSQIASYRTTADATAALGRFRAATQGCTEVRPTKGKNGFALKVTSEEPTASGYDEELRLRAVGSLVTANRQGFPLGMWISVIRLGNTLSIVRLFEVPDVEKGRSEAQTESKMDGFVAAAAARLTAAS